MDGNGSTALQHIITAVVKGNAEIIRWGCHTIQCDSSFTGCPNYPRPLPIGTHHEIVTVERLSGGCINSCYGVQTADSRYFVKVNDSSKIDGFFGELYGIIQLSVGAMRVPFPIAVGVVGELAFMVYEYLPIGSGADTQDWQQMGRQLAHLHNLSIGDINDRLTELDVPSEALLPTDGFGGYLNNTTLSGRYNYTGVHGDWKQFFATHRIEMQLAAMRAIHGHRLRHEQELQHCIDVLLHNHNPQRSLTHGDLWGGNAGFATIVTDEVDNARTMQHHDARHSKQHNKRRTQHSEKERRIVHGRHAKADNTTDHGRTPASHTTAAVIFDAAPYIADSETDIAMTRLFGGFNEGFYRGYHSVRQPSDGAAQREQLYNLYHILNHYNLFGGSYLSQAEHTIATLYRML